MDLRQQEDVVSCTVQGRGSQLHGFLVLLRLPVHKAWQFDSAHSAFCLKGHYIHLCSKSTDGPQVPTQATSYRTFGTGGPMVSMFSSFPNLRLLPISLSPSCRLQSTHLHSHSFWGKLSLQEMPLQPLLRVGAFWFTNYFCVNHPMTASLPSHTPTNVS